MPSDIDATVGGASSNSYCTLAEADSYFDDRPHSDAWINAGSTERTRALLEAAKRLERKVSWWLGYPDSVDQALQWPRYGVTNRVGKTILTTEIPQDLKNAQAEYALILLKEERVGGVDLRSSRGEIQKAKAGSVKDVDPPDHILAALSHLGAYRTSSAGMAVRT